MPEHRQRQVLMRAQRTVHAGLLRHKGFLKQRKELSYFRAAVPAEAWTERNFSQTMASPQGTNAETRSLHFAATYVYIFIPAHFGAQITTQTVIWKWFNPLKFIAFAPGFGEIAWSKGQVLTVSRHVESGVNVITYANSTKIEAWQ